MIINLVMNYSINVLRCYIPFQGDAIDERLSEKKKKKRMEKTNDTWNKKTAKNGKVLDVHSGQKKTQLGFYYLSCDSQQNKTKKKQP